NRSLSVITAENKVGWVDGNQETVQIRIGSLIETVHQPDQVTKRYALIDGSMVRVLAGPYSKGYMIILQIGTSMIEIVTHGVIGDTMIAEVEHVMIRKLT